MLGWCCRAQALGERSQPRRLRIQGLCRGVRTLRHVEFTRTQAFVADPDSRNHLTGTIALPVQ